MENLENMMSGRMPEDIQQSHVQQPQQYNPAEFLKKATGLNIDPENLPVTPVMSEDPIPQPQQYEAYQAEPNASISKTVPTQPVKPDVEEIGRIGTPVAAPISEPKTPATPTLSIGNESSAEMDEPEKWVKLSPEPNYGSMIKKKQDVEREKQNDLLNLMDESISGEEARLSTAEKATESREAYQEFLEKGGPVTEESGTPKVRYDNVTIEQRSGVKTFNPIAEEAAAVIDTDDLIPSYGDSDPENPEDTKDKKTSETEQEESPALDDEAAYAEYIRGLEVAKIEADKTVVKTVKNRQLDTVQSNKPSKFLGDQAFLNAVTRFKKDNFSVVSVPMVNSGFTIDIVGTGGVDLTQLYNRVSRETSQMDYEIEKMKVIMRNVVGTHPRIDPMQLKKYIHYRDYNMMAWGHICATLNNVEIVANCDDCGKPFRITSSPRALLMNMDEILQRQHEIEAADDINRYSLLISDRKIVTSNMFEITLGHPNYAEIISQMGQLRQYASNLSEIESAHFLDKANILYQIRQVKLPNGVVTSNIYQNYLAITLLSDGDYQILTDEVDKMQKDILEPKFGISTVKCPHCGHVLHDIPYENLDELVFFHTTVSRMLNTKKTEKPENTSTNG